MSKPIRLPFDPITRAAQLQDPALGEELPAARHGQRDVDHAGAAAAHHRVRRDGRRHGLTFARYEALVLLAFSREGRLSMGKIGQRLMVHPTSATNIVQRLAAQGFVERVPNPRTGAARSP